MQIRNWNPKFQGVAILGTVVLILGMTGCAEKRMLTKEQDEQVYELCHNGCMIVPREALEKMQRRGVEV